MLYDIKKMIDYFNSEQEKFLNKHGVKDVDAARRLWGDLGKATMLGNLTMEEAHKQYLQRIGLPENLLDEYEKFDKEAFFKAKLAEADVKEALNRLKNLGYKIAVLSDSGRSSKEMKTMFDYIGLGDAIDKIFVSSEIKHKKPEPETYNAVLSFFKIKPADAFFVGHDEDELKGAKSLGIKTISYRGDEAGDFTANSFYEILNIIKNQ